MDLNFNSFKDVYKMLGVPIGNMGCVMANVAPLPDMTSDLVDPDTLYVSPTKNWMQGFVADKSLHMTVLYGLLQDAAFLKPAIEKVMEGYELEEVEIEDVSFFSTPYGEEEPYYCIIAKIKKTPEVMEGHQRLSFLPHVNTFPEYSPHLTIAYIKSSAGEEYRDALIKNFQTLWVGKTLKVTGFSV